MTDHLSWETLNDLVDGLLPPAGIAAAEAHARGCVSCHESLSGLRATIAGARELTPMLAPPPDLWSDVRATIEARKVAHLPSGHSTRRSTGVWMTPGKLAVAAVFLMVVSASVTGLVMQRTLAGPPPSIVVATVPASWQASERAFQASVLELREQLLALHDHLSPQTLVKVEQALATIDLAIAEGREALLRDPGNAALSELVASNYRQKIELLRRVTQLASS
jgi:hypothetical protein